MGSKKILIGSVLKPVDDTRSYEKIGMTLAQQPDCEITIVGYHSQKKAQTIQQIHLIPLFQFPRISLKRLFAPLKFFRTLLKVKPDIIIVTTYELLIVSCAFRIIFGSRIYYDVQENYALNVWHSDTLPFLLKPILYTYIRAIEYSTRPFIKGYLLAEACYKSQCGFIGAHHFLAENKYAGPVISRTKKEDNSPTHLLYSGTIAESYGVFEAINFASALNKFLPCSLTIIGYSSSSTTLDKIKQKIDNQSFITLIGGDHLVPHTQIIETISSADFGLIPYRNNPSTNTCIPTKLYEYLALQLPIICMPNPLWQALIQRHQAGIIHDFAQAPTQGIIPLLQDKFYPIPAQGVFWNEYQRLLHNFIN
ncbi:glycosyltransferase [Cytophagales bacterium LB-30]|uniref:Glycosyltransferase n=1 Tax=Shiella aurantiaca TaxID=3058365 RepID=A0ABT8F0Z2_9BACT|nr:glycosyltransferase [Shiella aurantiaca]MDN4164113.1 glycosyltransferase [Shiella aurantiaca]